MSQPQVAPAFASNILPFTPRPQGAASRPSPLNAAGQPPTQPRHSPATTGTSLSIRDRIEVHHWQETAQAAGYDRLVIHEKSAFDPPELDSFLGLYRSGEAWSRWCIARCGAHVTAWCSLSGQDLGRFSSLAEALSAILSQGPTLPACA